MRQKVIRSAAEVILVRALHRVAAGTALETVQEALQAAVRYHDDPDAAVTLEQAQQAAEAVCVAVGELAGALVEERFDDVAAVDP